MANDTLQHESALATAPAAAWNKAMAALAKADTASDQAIDRYYRARDTYAEITGVELEAWGGPKELDPHADRLTGMRRAGDLSDRAIDAYADAANALILMPAPNLAALLWKMEHLFGEEADAGAGTACYCAEWGAALMSDARRLLTNGRP